MIRDFPGTRGGIGGRYGSSLVRHEVTCWRIEGMAPAFAAGRHRSWQPQGPNSIWCAGKRGIYERRQWWIARIHIAVIGPRISCCWLWDLHCILSHAVLSLLHILDEKSADVHETINRVRLRLMCYGLRSAAYGVWLARYQITPSVFLTLKNMGSICSKSSTLEGGHTVLGNDSASPSAFSNNDSAEERRKRILDAAESRQKAVCVVFEPCPVHN